MSSSAKLRSRFRSTFSFFDQIIIVFNASSIYNLDSMTHRLILKYNTYSVVVIEMISSLEFVQLYFLFYSIKIITLSWCIFILWGYQMLAIVLFYFSLNSNFRRHLNLTKYHKYNHKKMMSFIDSAFLFFICLGDIT